MCVCVCVCVCCVCVCVVWLRGRVVARLCGKLSAGSIGSLPTGFPWITIHTQRAFTACLTWAPLPHTTDLGTKALLGAKAPTVGAHFVLFDGGWRFCDGGVVVSYVMGVALH